MKARKISYRASLIKGMNLIEDLEDEKVKWSLTHITKKIIRRFASSN